MIVATRNIPAKPASKDIQILRVDPFHRVTGLLLPLVLHRMLNFAQTHYGRLNPEAQVRELGGRLVAGDPGLLVQAFVSPEGRVVGHAVSALQESYGQKWLFVIQCKMDEPTGDAITRAIQSGEEFARQNGATMLLFETRRSDSAWAKAYGFKVMRHIMYKTLNGHEVPVEAGESIEEREG